MPVAECQQRVSSLEFVEWLAFFDLEHIGPLFDEIRASAAACAVYNTTRDPKKRPDPYTAPDVFPWLRPEPAKPILLADPKEQTALLRAAIFGKGHRVKPKAEKGKADGG
jgi:hypothetical protein